MKKLLSASLAAAVAMTIAGCTGDDTIGPTGDGGSVTDGGGHDGSILPTDGGGDTGQNADGGDAGPCDFAAYVIDLVNNHTKDDTTPTTDLGSNCVDKQDQTQFKPLFP